MKKMRNGRRGFTLLEIVIVVAIIVILSTGAFLGVAATVNRASDAQEQLAINNGENFEAYARNQVDSYGKDMVYWDPIPNYTPENQAKKMKEQMMAEGWTDGEITFEYHEDGWHIVAEWDPTLPEHRGFQTPEDYKLWLSNYNNYIALGYTKEEIEKGCKDGSTDIKPVYDPSLHDGKSEEQYLKDKQGGGSGSGGQQGGNQQGGNQQGGNQEGGNQQSGGQQGGGQQQTSGPISYTSSITGKEGNVSANQYNYNTQPGQETGCIAITYDPKYSDLNVITIKAPSGLTFDSDSYEVNYNADAGTYTIKSKNGNFNPYGLRLNYSGVIGSGQYSVVDIGKAN